ncbi:MAG: HTH domain-containing protein [Erysipelotrichaceae bacterium]|nr:HTH domain-containing protein [Erysipelotrichaceae bacterium]
MKKLTDNEVNDLLNNPFVIRAGHKVVVFNQDFEKHYLKLIEEIGYSKHKAFKILGVDPVALGEQRIEMLIDTFIKHRLKEEYEGTYQLEDGSKIKAFNNIEEELEYYKRSTFRLRHSLSLLIKMDQLDKNYKLIFAYFD